MSKMFSQQANQKEKGWWAMPIYHTRLIWTASSYDVTYILFIPNNSDDFQSQCGRNEIGQVECYQSILNLLPCRDKCTGFMYNYAIMVESKNYYIHTIQSWWSITILALAVGKRTGLLVGVRYIYLRKNVELWWRVTSWYLARTSIKTTKLILNR